jgi:hypothetical protein
MCAGQVTLWDGEHRLCGHEPGAIGRGGAAAGAGRAAHGRAEQQLSGAVAGLRAGWVLREVAGAAVGRPATAAAAVGSLSNSRGKNANRRGDRFPRY